MLTKAEGRVLLWLEAADFDNTGCRHSQETIAAGAQCTVRTVIRATKRLRDLGLIDIEKERRPRCKWPCNVYHVRHWNPRKRSGVLNVLAARREAKCHAERTAGPSRAQTSVARPLRARSPRCYAVEAPALRSRARGETRFRRSSVTDPLRLPVECDECARKDKIIRQYAENHSKLVEEVSATDQISRAVGKENDRLVRENASLKSFVKGLNTKEANKLVTDEKVDQVIDYWCELRPKTRRQESFPEDGKRRELIVKALKLMTDAEVGDVAAVCEALEGINLRPYEAFGQWYAEPGKGRKRRSQLEDALRDETRIDKFRMYAWWSKAAPSEQLWAVYQALSGTGELYLRRAVSASYGTESGRDA